MPKRSRRDSLTSEESCFSNNDQSSLHSSIVDQSSSSAIVAPGAGLALRKRRRQGASLGAAAAAAAKPVADQCQQALDSLRQAKTANGVLICEPFIRLPSRRSQPELFESVANPIDLTRIQAKVKSDEYANFEAFAADLDLLVSNARSVYKPGSQELQSANDVAELVVRLRADAAAASGAAASTTSSVSPTATSSGGGMQRPRRAAASRRMDGGGSSVAGSDCAEDNSEFDRQSLAHSEDATNEGAAADSSVSPQILQELLLAAVTRLSDDSGRSVTEHFEVLPSPKDYPQYYEVIRDPVDLRMIANRVLRGGHYKSLEDLERDLALMVRNARTFNEPKSEVYLDALAINRQLKACRVEVLNSRGVRSAALLAEARAATERLSKLPDPEVAELLDEEAGGDAGAASGEAESEEDETYSPDDPRSTQIRLFTFVVSYRNSQGQNLAEPFLRLPQKRLYPDYYEDIKNPLSLLQVRSRIRRRFYPNLDAMFEALNLVFNNARQYNIEESKIHKDAARLQKLARAKRDELCGLASSSSGAEAAAGGGSGSDDLKPLLPQKLVNPLFPQQSLFNNEDSMGSSSASASMMLHHQQQPQHPQFSMTHTPTQQQQPPSTGEKRKRAAPDPQEVLQRRLNNLYGHVYNATEEGTGRLLREIFVKLPPKNEYPMYYEVIPEPIDLTIIRAKIDARKYETHHQLVSDLKLMFANAKHFNEEKSQVHQDAIYLEKLLKKKIKNLGPVVNASGGGPGGAGSGPGSTPRLKKSATDVSITSSTSAAQQAAVSSSSSLPRRLQDLFHTVRDYRDPVSGRVLSSVFARLPTRQELPQYYEFIKKPIDLTSIQSKLGSGKYTQAADMLADFELMFDNACLFNETGSQIYQDALVLLRVVMEKRRLLRLDEDPAAAEVPDVMAAVRDVMKGLLTQTMNHADEDGRLLVDSFDELYDESHRAASADGSSDRPVIPLEEIFHRVQSGRYRRFQRFQEDLFDAFARIRAAAPSRQSQIYKDACELQRFFVRTRDSMLCVSKYSTGSSGSLQSPASGFTCKMLEELLKSEAAKSATDSTAEAPVDTDDGFQSNTDIKEAETTAGVKVLVSDFVYVRDEDQTLEPIPDPSQSGQVRIGQVVGFACETNSPTESANGEGGGGGSRLLVRVNWFLKPKQTVHSRHRKFLPNEVFKTDQRATVPANSILGKCMVMSIKDFENFMPRGFDFKDVYACEFQYCAGQHSFFQKITRWTSPRPDGVTNDKRPSPIGLHRMAVVPYVFEAPKHEDPTATSIIESLRENVVLEDRSQTEGLITYDQYAADPNSGLWLRLGDFVYVPSVDGTGRTIVRVDKLWRNTVQNCVYFSGPWFLPPKDVEHLPTMTLYAKEYFLCSVEHSTHMLSSVLGRCCILSLADYSACRPTEYAEDDVYICESKYFLEDKAIRKLRKGLKKFTNQPGTIEDEVYFFKQPIVPRKSVTPLLYEASQTPLDMDQLTASSAAAASSALSSGGGNGAGSLNFDDDNTRDSMSTSTTMDEVPTTPGTPQGGRNNRTGASSKKKKCPSGYVVYASEVRKRIMMENEGAGFGDISREVGQMWRKLPQSEKDVYERRAADTRAKMEAEKAAAAAAAAATAAASAPSRQSPPTQQQQYPIAQPPMMPHHQYQPAYQQQPMVPQQQQQQFMGQQPVYPQQMAYPPQQPQQGVTFYPVSGPAQQQMQYQQQHRPAGVNGFPPHQQQPMLSMQQPQQQQQPPPQLPVFVAAPPKTTRALHSEIYKRYIERLRSNSAYLSDWDRQATPAQLNCKPNASVTQQLHDSFLGAPAYQKQQQQQQQQQQAELTNALCSLRDHLLRDALKIELSLNQL